jgi:hypothetical protein
MKFYWLGLGVLTVWRLTHLLNAEDGPWNLVFRLRQRAGTGFWAGLLDCFYCLSVWIAAPLAYVIGSTWKERLLLWPAMSAAAILLERLAPEKPEPPPHYSEERSETRAEDREDLNVLRQEPTAVSDAASPADGRSGRADS